MNEIEIQTKLNDLADCAMRKGVTKPEAYLIVNSHAESRLMVKWDDGSTIGHLRGFTGHTLKEAFDKAHVYIDSLPTIEEIRKQEFLEAVARAIEKGKEAGIDMEYVAPLMDMIKKLSENVITRQ